MCYLWACMSKKNMDHREALGLIIGTNAVMVVVLAISDHALNAALSPLRVIAAGALLYAVGMGVFALSRNFGSFMLGMIGFTFGELSLVPTATALVANIAPADMRARYMGIFSLSFRIGAGIGPVIGGVLSDTIAPVATWVGGVGVCLVAALGFWLLARSQNLTTQSIAHGPTGNHGCQYIGELPMEVGIQQNVEWLARLEAES